MLTGKQRAALVFIVERLNETGVPPSFDEMGRKLGQKSKAGVARLLDRLQDRGFIRRIPNRARAIEVIKMPPGADDAVQAERRRCAGIISCVALRDYSLMDAAKAIDDGTSVADFERHHTAGSRRQDNLV